MRRIAQLNLGIRDAERILKLLRMDPKVAHVSYDLARQIKRYREEEAQRLRSILLDDPPYSR